MAKLTLYNDKSGDSSTNVIPHSMQGFCKWKSKLGVNQNIGTMILSNAGRLDRSEFEVVRLAPGLNDQQISN